MTKIKSAFTLCYPTISKLLPTRLHALSSLAHTLCHLCLACSLDRTTTTTTTTRQSISFIHSWFMNWRRFHIYFASVFVAVVVFGGNSSLVASQIKKQPKFFTIVDALFILN